MEVPFEELCTNFKKNCPEMTMIMHVYIIIHVYTCTINFIRFVHVRLLLFLFYFFLMHGYCSVYVRVIHVHVHVVVIHECILVFVYTSWSIMSYKSWIHLLSDPAHWPGWAVWKVEIQSDRLWPGHAGGGHGVYWGYGQTHLPALWTQWAQGYSVYVCMFRTF